MRRLLLLVTCLVLLSACTPAVIRHNEVGNDRFAEDAYEEAIDEYRLAQVAEPDKAEPYYNAANAYNRMAQVDGTLAQTQQALKTANDALAEQVWYNLGNAHFDAELWAEAVEAYKEALRHSPDDLDAKHNLELALQRLQEQEQQQDQQGQEVKDDDQGENTEDQAQDESTDPSPTPTPEPAGEAGSSEEQQSDEGPIAEQSEESAEDDGMTAQQAAQLIQSLVGDSETLQERLQRMRQVPGVAPEQDW